MSTDARSRTAILEERVHVLSAGLGLEGQFEVPFEVRKLVDEGEMIKAIKELRQRTPGRLSLVAAKRMVDALAER
jgi:ribosomal protein L7/L12